MPNSICLHLLVHVTAILCMLNALAMWPLRRSRRRDGDVDMTGRRRTPPWNCREERLGDTGELAVVLGKQSGTMRRPWQAETCEEPCCRERLRRQPPWMSVAAATMDTAGQQHRYKRKGIDERGGKGTSQFL